jgi:hypothetical protein
MSAPIFTKTSNAYTPITFEKGRLFPATDTLEPRQTVQESGSGAVQVCTHGGPQQWLEADFGFLSSTQMANLSGFLQDPTVDFKAHTFTFTDENAVDYEVRWWSDNLPRQTTRNFKKNIKMLLRVE